MNKKPSNVEIGNKFEKESYSRIIKAIEDEEFAFPLKYTKVKQKAKYYSKRIEKNIIFDLSIEIWPPKSKNYANVYIIECKSYTNKKVPIGDLRKFSYDVKDVAELNGKAVFISNSPFSEPSVTFAKNTGMMLIEVNENNSHNILLHRKNNSTSKKDNQFDNFEEFIKNVYKSDKIDGLRRLSKLDIEQIAHDILIDFDYKIVSNFEKNYLSEFIHYFEKNHDLKFIFKTDILAETKERIVGQYNVKNKTIVIDKSVINTARFGFILAHEIGHHVLHSKLKMNQNIYDDFSDSEYDFESDRHLLVNDKNWIEWQANRFASSILMPDKNLKIRLSLFQESIGISRRGHIFVDNQQINISDYHKCTSYLSAFFNVTKTSLIFRLEELNLITDKRKKDDFNNSFRNLFR